MRFSGWIKQREMPSLLLQPGADAYLLVQFPLGLYAQVAEVPSLEESFVHVVVPVSELECVPRREVVRDPGLLSAPPTSDTISDQIALVGVTRSVASVPVECARTEVIGHIQVCRDSLHTST